MEAVFNILTGVFIGWYTVHAVMFLFVEFAKKYKYQI